MVYHADITGIHDVTAEVWPMENVPVAALAPNVKLVGVWVAAILTLMIYSHLIKDNPLSRLAEHLFVGTAAGYAAVLAYYNVLSPRLIQPLFSDPRAHYALLIPAVLALFLILRPIAPLRALASLPLAVIIGVGAALALAGAIAGSLLPQVQATMLSLSLSQPVDVVINNLIIIIGVTSAVMSFYFTVRPTSVPGRMLRPVVFIGRMTMVLALGAVFGATVTARLALLVGRAQFLLGDWLGLLK
jgi:hypothetical protein